MRRVTGFLLWLYVFTVPWDFVAIPVIGGITRLVGIVITGAAILMIAAEGRFRKPDMIFGLAVAFTASSALSLLWTVSYPATVQAVGQYVQLLTSVWVVREVARTRAQQQSLLVAFCLGAFIPMVSLLDHFRTGVQLGGSSGRYTATGLNADGVGLLLVIGIPITWHLMLTSAGKVRAIALIYFVLAPVAILLTGTRGAFLAGIVAVSIVPLTLARQSLRPVLVTLLLILLTATIAPIVPQSSWARMATIPGEIAGGGSMSMRRDIWKAGFHIFPERPLLGVGAGAYGAAVQSSPENHLNPTTIAHNLLIGLLVEQGIVGLLLFTALFGACVMSIFGMPPSDRVLWAVLMLCWFVGMMSLSLERWKVTWLLFGLLAAYDNVGPVRRQISQLQLRTDINGSARAYRSSRR